MGHVFALDAVDGDFFQELDADVKVENGAHANRSKETYEERLAQLFYLMNVLVHGYNNREPA